MFELRCGIAFGIEIWVRVAHGYHGILTLLAPHAPLHTVDWGIITKLTVVIFCESLSTVRMTTAANRMNLTQILNQAQERFNRRVENALKDVGIGFIQGKSAIVTENSTNQSKTLRLLQVLYDATRAKSEPVFVGEVDTGLSAEDAKAAWRYLRDRGLIDIFNIPYTARINGAVVDAIEGAQRRPDQASANFPSLVSLGEKKPKHRGLDLNIIM